jgi:AcrR family transcriptional regulator
MSDLPSTPVFEPPTKLPQSIVRIMQGALQAIGARGTRRLSMSDICDASAISRGTLYRYFSTKEDVLAAVSEYVSSNFESGVRDAAEAFSDPLDRFRAVMRFYYDYTAEHTPDRIFEIEPTFHIEFFRSHFGRHKIAVHAALEVTFDYLDSLADQPIDRDALTEILVRMQLSTLIIPGNEYWMKVWDQMPDGLERWVMTLAGRTPALREK